MRWLIALALGGCLGPSTTTCADGTTCPSPEVCSPAGGCAGPDQLAACDGHVDGANCGAVQFGVCQRGVCLATHWNPTVLVGGSLAATDIGLNFPGGVAEGADGALYIADSNNNVVRRLDRNGVVTTVAGNGNQGFSGDGGLGPNAALSEPLGVAVDGVGNVYIADSGNSRIRRVDIGGVITTIAGTSKSGSQGDGGAATDAELSAAAGVAVDGFGNIFIADTFNSRIRLIDLQGIITTIAGVTPGFGGDGGLATDAQIAIPVGVAVDGTGGYYIADSGNNRIRHVAADQKITTVAGGMRMTGSIGDGGLATDAILVGPHAITFTAGKLLIADTGNDRIRLVDGSGVITTIAGSAMKGFAGDGALATNAALFGPGSVAMDTHGQVFIADTSNSRIREIDSTGIIRTVVGRGDAVADSGDGSFATSASIATISNPLIDASGALYFSDGAGNRVRRVDTSGVITTIAGTGISGFQGDGGPATSAQFRGPQALAFDGQGGLLVVDTGNNCVRRIDASGAIATIAGGGNDVSDGVPATAEQLQGPTGVAVDQAGNIYIAEATAPRIRRVDPTGTITTFAGTGIAGGDGENNPAIAATLDSPQGLAVDAAGNLFIADSNNHRIRRVDTSGTITTVAGSSLGFAGDGGAATAALLAEPLGVAFDAAGNLYIADSINSRIRKVDATTKTISTVLGAGGSTDDGDGGFATSAALGRPAGVAIDALGNLYAASDFDVRRVDAITKIVTTVAGNVDPPRMGPIATSRLAGPVALVLAPPFSIVAGGTSGTIQVIRDTAIAAVAGRYLQPSAISNLARYRGRPFGDVGGVAFDAANNLIYLTESNAAVGSIHAVAIVDPADPTTWTIADLVDAPPGFADGPLASAHFRDPRGVYLDGSVLYIADTGNHVIRAIDLTTSVASTIAGSPETLGFFGDGGPATGALLDAPQAVTRCGDDIFVADTGNDRVRRVTGDGTITTVIGDGTTASSGEGSPASTFPVDAPISLACDTVGNLFVTSRTSVRMLIADDAGIVDGSGPVRTIYGLATDGFPAAVTHCLAGLAVVDAATLRITDACNGFAIELARQPVP